MGRFEDYDIEVAEEQIRKSYTDGDRGVLEGFGFGFDCPGKVLNQVHGWEVKLVDRRGMGNHGSFVAIPATEENYEFAKKETRKALRKLAEEAEENGTITERGNFATVLLPYLYSKLSDRKGTFLFQDEKFAYFAHAVANYLNIGNATFRVWLKPRQDPKGFELRRQVAVRRNTFVTEKQLAIAKIIANAFGYEWKGEWSPTSDNVVTQLDAEEVTGIALDLRPVEYQTHNIWLGGWEIGFNRITITLEGGARVSMSVYSAWSIQNGYNGFEIKQGAEKAPADHVQSARATLGKILAVLGVKPGHSILSDPRWAEISLPEEPPAHRFNSLIGE